MRSPACPACGSARLGPLLDLRDVPVAANVFYDRAEDAAAVATAPLRLRACQGCGSLHNAAFDPSLVDYAGTYENSLHHSGVFARHARALADRLVAAHRLHGGTVVELGCGNGEFLALLVEAGLARGLGLDPSYAGPADPADGVVVLAEPYVGQPLDVGRDVGVGGVRDAFPDLVCCLHVLEHLVEPGLLLQAACDGLFAAGTVGYVEVPDARATLQDGAVWDLIYEHHSYFTAPGLRRLLRGAGFVVTQLERAFSGQYLGAEVRRQGPGGATDDTDRGATDDTDRGHDDDDEVADLLDLAARFRTDYERRVAETAGALTEAAGRGEVVVLWGAGSKGVNVLTTADPARTIHGVVDVNPAKQGRYVPLSAHRVLPPGQLPSLRPDVVLATNEQYRDEIRRALDQLGVGARLQFV